jgi:hypothetical protein
VRVTKFATAVSSGPCIRSFHPYPTITATNG